MKEWRTRIQHVRNTFRKLRAGVPLYGENVSPEVSNDLFVAHAAVYYFFARYAAGRRVLDVGCGTAYGVNILLRSGAEKITAVDIDPRNIRYARKRNIQPEIEFRVADAQDLDAAALGTFDVIVSSNVFEHLTDVPGALRNVQSLLRTDGTFVLAVPPITDEVGLRQNMQNPFHKSNLYVGEWHAELSRHFAAVQLVAHLPPLDAQLDFADPFPSRIAAETFRFEERSLALFSDPAILAAIFVCTGVHVGERPTASGEIQPS